MAVYAASKYYVKEHKRYQKHLYKAIDEKRDVVFTDETGFAPETCRSHGWGPKGQRVYGEKPSNKRPRTGLVGGYRNNKLIAPFLFNGTMTAALYNAWLQQELLPTLRPHSVIVMDNAAFHKTRETIRIIRSAGHKPLFLPPYSPHLNPIEKLWGNIKRLWSYNQHLILDQLINMCLYIFK